MSQQYSRWQDLQKTPGVSRNSQLEELRQRVHQFVIEQLGPMLADENLSEHELRRLVHEHVNKALADEKIALLQNGDQFQQAIQAQANSAIAKSAGAAVSAVSVNGVDWSNAGEGGNDIVFGDGRFVIVGEGYGIVTENGVDATRHNQPPLGRVAFGVVDGAPTWLGFNFPAVRRVSTDGESWQNVADDRGNAVDDLLFLP